jgi:glycosyltransferase involved in cell wall biosynthesis
MNNVCMIICHFNDPFLRSALASLKKQTRKIDIVLVDDGFLIESDREKTTVRHVSEIPSFATLCRGIETIKPKETRGIGYARNIGIKYALEKSYEHIGFLDSDGVAHPFFVKKALTHLQEQNSLLGVCARKGIANPKIRIAKVKYRYKIYKKDDFQLDCSLFRAKAFEKREMPRRKSGEDSVFILSFKQGELEKLDIPFYHFERERISAFFRDEFYGAYYGFKTNMTKTFFQIFITPFTSLKMIFRNRWVLEGLLFPFRQYVWVVGFLLGVQSER